MAKSQETFNKKEKEKKRLKKRQDKLLKKDERKANSDGGGLENMMAYLDEFGNIVDTPPDPTIKKKKIIAGNIELGVPKREDAGEAEANEGKVTFYNESKGYGFIKDGRNSENYFSIFSITVCVTPVKLNPPSWNKFCIVTKRVKSLNNVIQ